MMTAATRTARRSIRTGLASASLLLLIAATCSSTASAAQPAVGLGTADSFAVLSGASVSNTGTSTVNGDLGVSPGTAITGFPPGVLNGTMHAADAVAAQAQLDLTTAYNDAAGRGPALAVTADLGGLTVTGGVYRSASSLGLTGTLTLDAQGDPSTVFVFQAGSSMTTASASRVSLINGAQPCNVVWQIGSSATLGTSSVFAGNILALTSISMNDGVTLNGRALARNGSVTLIHDTITAAKCAVPIGGVTGGGTGGVGGGGGAGGGGGTTFGGTAILSPGTNKVGQVIARYGTDRCVRGSFTAIVRGLAIRKVVFSNGSRTLAIDTKAPYSTVVTHTPGLRKVVARVTFTDGTPPRTLVMPYRSCAALRAALPRKPITPPAFTG